MFLRIANHIRHQSFFPTLIDTAVAVFACRGANIGGGSRRSRCPRLSRRNRSCYWQIPYVEHESPSILIRHLPAWHCRVSDTIPDEVEHFAIGGMRDLRTSQIQRLWIQAATRFGLAAPIVTVTDLAFLPVQFLPGEYIDTPAISHQRILHGFR